MNLLINRLGTDDTFLASLRFFFIILLYICVCVSHNWRGLFSTWTGARLDAATLANVGRRTFDMRNERKKML